MSEAIQKIESILKNEYSTKGFVDFAVEIFDSLKIVAPEKFHKEFSNFSSHIEGYSHIGDYCSPDVKKVAVFSVRLKIASYVENSRSTQRSYARKLIEAGNCDAAVIAFHSPNESKWRLSFVRLDYDMKFENGKFKTTENLTPAKRYSFLVGKEEPCHTAVSRFHKFIIDKNYNPSLDELEEAFSVEKVTKEFFDLYCEKFYQLQEHLDSNQDFKDESTKCGFTSEQFVKKLMGQIVFLYFLQKKGWLGVSTWPPSLTEKEFKNVYFVSGAHGRIIREHLSKLYAQLTDGNYKLNAAAFDELSDDDEEVIASHMPCTKTWGDGSKKFLRTIFDWSQKHKGQFYEEYLEPLFYNTLNRNRGALGYCPELHCKVPFLSGGLFEPLDNYDWKSNRFNIPDEMFSNRKDENDREGTGVLDIFDRYNFTISEDEPMEREVAIDPEMLGKVFENLLEVKDRKSKGAFYTPREIVHYMCQESLINYLVTKTGLQEDGIRDFILYGDLMKDEDTSKEKREGTRGMFISEKLFKIDETGNIVINRLKDIDNALAQVRIADPAVGSGAFPLGMMNEIVRARQNISAYITINMSSSDKRFLLQNERAPYFLKRHTIKNTIFAVDIEPSAVDIAQLRLWLSLVIDDEINPNAQNELEGHRDPLPLPNLDCNILCGNSLVDEFMGVRLVKESDIIGTMHEGVQMDLGHATFEVVLQKLLEEQDKLFYCDDTIKKEEIKKNVQSYKDMIIKEQLAWANPDVKAAYESAKHQASKPFILWQLDFARVFNEKGGFDIVVGNPPYVDSEEMTRSMPEDRKYYTRKFKSTKGNWDLFIPFIEKGLNLLARGGTISYIVPNKLISAPYAAEIKKIISTKEVMEIRDYSNVNVFKSAAVYPVVFRICDTADRRPVSMNVMEDMTQIHTHNCIDVLDFYADVNWDKYFTSKAGALDIVNKIGKFPQLQILASVNGAATVTEAYLIKDFLFDSTCSQKCTKKFINTGGIDRYKSFYGKEYITYLKAKYLNPIVTCDDLIKMSHKRMRESDEPKIIIGGMTKILEGYYDSGEYLAGKSTTIVYGYEHLKYITALINSKLLTFYYQVYFNSMSLAGGYYRVGAPQIKSLPIAIPNEDSIIDEVEKKVDEIQSALQNTIGPNDIVYKIIDDIDRIIYKIYGLTKSEIAVVEEHLL